MSDRANTSDASADRCEPTSSRVARAGYMLGGVTGKGFMPGQSGNPSGKAKRRTIEDDLRRILAEVPAGGSMDKQEGLVRVWLDEVICKLNTRAMIALLARLFPVAKPKDDSAEAPTAKILFMKDPDEESDPPGSDPDVSGT